LAANAHEKYKQNSRDSTPRKKVVINESEEEAKLKFQMVDEPRGFYGNANEQQSILKNPSIMVDVENQED